MAAHDPSTPIHTVFSVSGYVGAYPMTRRAMGYAAANLGVCAVVVSAIVVRNEVSAAHRPPTDIVSMILEHLESVEVSLQFFMNFAAVMAYIKYDMTSVMRSVYHVHDCIFKLGIVPVYSRTRVMFLLAVTIGHILTEYALSVSEALSLGEIDMAVFYCISAFNEMVIHTYTAQFFSLMELLQYQMKAITGGLTHENQWYVESIINVQCHLLQTTKYVYAMYVKVITMAIVHSTISIMTHTYEVTNELNYSTIVVIAFELIVILCIVDACGQMEFKVDDFNSRLFKLMRLSKGLCQNNKLYVFLTSKQDIKFTACGFFTINYSLIVSIIAAVTTYLVILVQLSKPQEAIKFD